MWPRLECRFYLSWWTEFKRNAPEERPFVFDTHHLWGPLCTLGCERLYGPRFHLRIRSTNLTSCWSISLGRHWICVYTILGFSPSLAPFCIWCPEVYWNKHIFNSIQVFICWDGQRCYILTLRLTEIYLLLGSWTWLNFLHLLVKSSAHSFADISALFHSEVKLKQKWW